MTNLKPFFLPALLAAALFPTLPVASAAEEKGEKRVTFKTADGKYLTAADKGAFNLSGQGVTTRTVFAVVDANGGTLEDGDEITVRYYPSAMDKPSYLQEKEGKLFRDKEPTDASGKFRLKKQAAGFVLKTGGGKFVVYTSKEVEIADTAASALVFTIEEPPAQLAK